MVEPLVLPDPLPITDQTISTAASASASTSGFKRGLLDCKKINSSSWMNYNVRTYFS